MSATQCGHIFPKLNTRKRSRKCPTYPKYHWKKLSIVSSPSCLPLLQGHWARCQIGRQKNDVARVPRVFARPFFPSRFLLLAQRTIRRTRYTRRWKNIEPLLPRINQWKFSGDNPICCRFASVLKTIERSTAKERPNNIEIMRALFGWKPFYLCPQAIGRYHKETQVEAIVGNRSCFRSKQNTRKSYGELETSVHTLAYDLSCSQGSPRSPRLIFYWRFLQL